MLPGIRARLAALGPRAVGESGTRGDGAGHAPAFFKITRDKAVAAGIPKYRPVYSKKTGWWYLLAAKEMWTYVSFWFGKAHQQWPPAGKRFKDEAEFNEKFEAEVKPWIASRKGLVAFDKIFGYSGTGHVDIFEGEKLSDAGNWYPCQSLEIWLIG